MNHDEPLSPGWFLLKFGIYLAALLLIDHEPG